METENLTVAATDCVAHKIIRLVVSEDIVVFDVVPSQAESISAQKKIPKTTFNPTEVSGHRMKLMQYGRSILAFLESLKDKHSLALRLQQRDSQATEKCKSLQRSYISNFRQRRNGKFSAESNSTRIKIRAPFSIKNDAILSNQEQQKLR
jgi:hypothetical protein